MDKIIELLLAKGKGILAADESNRTAAKRLSSVSVEDTEENRRLYRNLFLSTPDIEKYISGVILYKETLGQKDNNGVSFVEVLQKKGIVPGIKVDLGVKDFPGLPGEKITEGLDGLRGRVKEYYKKGARFAKWRAVITIGENIPTRECIHTNAIILALYSKICQEEGLVPIVEPEVLLDGKHSIERAEEVTTNTISEVFYQAKRYSVDRSKMILKTSMVLPGKESKEASNEEIAKATVRTLKNSVPEEVPGVVFLSGGQGPKEATEHLNEITKLEPLPWELAFSYARALQGPSLEIWRGKEENVKAAQEKFVERLKESVLADKGEL
ncbi:MAG: fructose-bisphosphate aldolase class I [Candidatus Pacebacteria bacterium]|nr:fructose-bisphosphate aldolase class I [Candidatus Paceibacterota bacterium]